MPMMGVICAPHVGHTHAGKALRAAMARACRDALRTAFQRDTTKRISQVMAAYGVSVGINTIKDWLSPTDPQMPSAEHFALLAAAFGWPFIRLVYAPCVAEEKVSSEDRLDEIAQEIADIKRQLRATKYARHQDLRAVASVGARSAG